MWLCRNGKTAEYSEAVDGIHYLKDDGFLFPRIVFAGHDKLYETREESIIRALDDLEQEGCNLYLELHPAPEKGEYAFIAQDPDGEWCGFYEKPTLYDSFWGDGGLYYFIQKSPRNPFWRKTLR